MSYFKKLKKMFFQEIGIIKGNSVLELKTKDDSFTFSNNALRSII